MKIRVIEATNKYFSVRQNSLEKKMVCISFVIFKLLETLLIEKKNVLIFFIKEHNNLSYGQSIDRHVMINDDDYLVVQFDYILELSFVGFV